MTDIVPPNTDRQTLFAKDARSDWVRLGTLLTLRWLAAVGQITAVLLAYYLFDIALRLDHVLFVILLSVSFNIVAQLILPDTRRLSENATTLMLLFDLMQLGALLFLTGGITNPFVMLIIAPVVISATALTLRATVGLGLVAVMLTTLLTIWFQPLVFKDGTVLMLPSIYMLGMWCAVLISAIFLGMYARRVTVETFSMNQALLATQMALAREQRLSALGGVVAAAAHELGTPLATIKLTAAELEDDISTLDVPDHVREDIALIREQTDRCREILKDMGRAGKEDTHLRYAPVSAMVEEAAEPHADRGKRLILRVDGSTDLSDVPDQPVVVRKPELLHGLRNLIQNAVDFAETTVWIDVDWDETAIRIAVGDDGPGYPADMIGRIGDPFVRRRGARGADPRRPGYEGMGLGLFIAKTLLERSGASLTFTNASSGARKRPSTVAAEYARPSGALVEGVWRRATIEASSGQARGPLGLNPRVSS
ncbi:two-component system sensor histidine kinase RegB [Rubricella aquisinus]|uniref:histidine kinase n=1 Tax=Rubricella aquisinus TaxID=2028108 RepID=A0A840WUZ6_9RHOB|nr:ActS/PrrB/RegB family redox-sensitive histidine kinase [Rubricella aquisinus]MBB5514044.1 two-component system sensor histidine kinase RegB [Rubricella aquisinus]